MTCAGVTIKQLSGGDSRLVSLKVLLVLSLLVSVACCTTTTIHQHGYISEVDNVDWNALINRIGDVCHPNLQEGEGYLPQCTLFEMCQDTEVNYFGNASYCHPLSLFTDFCSMSEFAGIKLCLQIHSGYQDLPSSLKYVSSDTGSGYGSMVGDVHVHPFPKMSELQKWTNQIGVSEQCQYQPSVWKCHMLYRYSMFCIGSPDWKPCQQHRLMCTSSDLSESPLCSVARTMSLATMDGIENVKDEVNCLVNSNDPTCVDYRYPEDSIMIEIDALCNSGHIMIGCSIRAECNKKGNFGAQCSSFSIWTQMCKFDMPMMGGCRNYQSLCGANSVVAQCKEDYYGEKLPKTKETFELIKSICDEMTMDGCDKCTKMDMSCSVLDIYSDLCLAMPDMTQCGLWRGFCSKTLSSTGFCPSSIPRPIMRMYFHHSLAEYVLFKEWVPTNILQYILTLICIFVATIALDAIRFGQLTFNNKVSPSGCHEEYRQTSRSYSLKNELARALIHVAEITLGFMVMLVAMTFNIGLFCAILAGSFVGSLLFGRHISGCPKSSCH